MVRGVLSALRRVRLPERGERPGLRRLSLRPGLGRLPGLRRLFGGPRLLHLTGPGRLRVPGRLGGPRSTIGPLPPERAGPGEGVLGRGRFTGPVGRLPVTRPRPRPRPRLRGPVARLSLRSWLLLRWVHGSTALLVRGARRTRSVSGTGQDRWVRESSAGV
ncbi:hypothetical protein B7R87_22350 [Streptomyces tsukubensis]|uniref:Uncharacterized protein n=1 Tax=Streptomyces tsukubensis (strain DSM 42081 / NBRC 108919 / NRRL 18488 / 9993) TaxID=1114943 RepID=I2N5J3_STRT9|nr:hypothetical protein B7R87_22350 [Streptomyces tsukubensis]EIF92290.1 hypothetical protein [Streptomyces tsukubensis NRRL18488]QKM67685.1 hypothetical protein STSU_011440 [Streptomyces tsukubensis NRRL18488]